MKDEKRAACEGRYLLFEAVDRAAHLEARELCATCPILDDCKLRLADERKQLRSCPEGTWAGLLFIDGKRKKVNV